MLRLWLGCLLGMGFALSAAPAADETPKVISPWQLRAAVNGKPTGKDLDQLRRRVVATFGEKELRAGARPRVEDTLACWAITVEDKAAVPYVVLVGDRKLPMRPLGEGSDVYVLFGDLPNFTELAYSYRVAGRRLGAGTVRVEHFTYGPDSFPRNGVPRGKVTKHEWKSKTFPDTVRDYWVYVPAQYNPDGPPACVMVFQDGGGYLGPDFRTTTVFDNLIHQKEIPVLIGIFINPGVIPREGKQPESNRSFEYDTPSDQYARFLRDEILPEVGKHYKLRDEPASRAIAGISSGGICAFTVAWQMPEEFGKVLSHVGSFTNIRGGHVYPSLIRKTPKKKIRVYLQAGRRDLDNEHGSWPLANQEMAAALKYKGYDLYFVMGEGFHSGRHGGSILPESLKWLWRDFQAKAAE